MFRQANGWKEVIKALINSRDKQLEQAFESILAPTYPDALRALLN